jgi:hypothetical protein
MLKRYLKNPTLDMETLTLSGEEVWLDDSQEMKFDRAAVGAAKSAGKTAESEASKYGTQATGERAPLQAYDVQQLTHPTGFGQQGVGEMLTAALGGAGGASAAIEGGESLAAKRGTTGENTAMLDEVARQRLKAGASASEGIAAENVKAKLDQQKAAADDLSRRYGIDVSAQLGQEKAQTEDINAQVEAGKSGWFQNLMQGIQTGTQVATSLFAPGGGGGMLRS